MTEVEQKCATCRRTNKKRELKKSKKEHDSTEARTRDLSRSTECEANVITNYTIEPFHMLIRQIRHNISQGSGGVTGRELAFGAKSGVVEHQKLLQPQLGSEALTSVADPGPARVRDRAL